MTITLDFAPIEAFIAENPWPTVALVFLIGIVAPSIWSRCPQRRRAAQTVIQAIGATATATAAALRGTRRP